MNIAAACFLVVDFLRATFLCKLGGCLGLVWPHHLRAAAEVRPHCKLQSEKDTDVVAAALIIRCIS